MAITINGNGTIGGVSVGGLPDGTVTPSDLSTGHPNWDSSGNVGIGTSSPDALLDIEGPSATHYINATSGNANTYYELAGTLTGSIEVGGGDSVYLSARNAAGDMIFRTGGTNERMRIDSSGQVGIGASPYAPLTVSYAKASDTVADIRNTSGTSPYGLRVGLTGTTPNNASQYFITCPDATNTKATLYSNGGLANYQANNTNLSDAREKTDLEDSKNYLDVICSIPVKTFKYIDQTDEDRTLGVIAQDVQEVAPELVSEDDWGTPENPKVRLGIYQTDFQYALMKSIQELKTLVDTQQQTIESLEARVATLESA